MTIQKKTSPPGATGEARKDVRIGIANSSETSIFDPFGASDSSLEEPLLPQVRAARERDRLARARVKAGQNYQPGEDELIDARAWRRRRR
jgi:hypothetical protein